MKSKSLLIACFWILACSLLVLKVYFQTGVPYTHDGENHLARFANYWVAVKEGQIPPRFAPNLVNHYGYPVFNYNYPLANILSLPLTAVGFSFEMTFKMLMCFAVIFGVSGTYIFSKRLGLSELQSLLAVTLVGLQPWLVVTTTYRGNIGEIFAWAMLPWIALWILSTKKFSTHFWFLLSGILLLSSFSLSHTVAVILSLPLIISGAVWLYRTEIRTLILMLVVAVISFLLTAWYWIPALAERPLITQSQVELSKSAGLHTATVSQLLLSPNSFGFSLPGSIDTLPLTVGWWMVVGTAISLVVLIKQKKVKQVSLIFIGLILYFASMTTQLWNIPGFSLLGELVQFPWRLLLFSSWLVIPIVITFPSWPRFCKYFFGIVLLVAALSTFQVQPVDRRHAADDAYILFSQSTTTNNENMPKTFMYREMGTWQPGPIILSGNATAASTYWSGSKRNYTLSVASPSSIAEPTMFFSGWQTTANGKLVSYIDSSEIGGRIAYQLDPGTYEIQTEFTQWTPSRIIGNSLFFIGCFSLGLLYRQLKMRLL